MRIFGLTGGSGSGKGVAADGFRALGAGVVDADAIYRALCADNRPMLEELEAAFGAVRTFDGGLDRRKLATIVFGDAERLARLNEITFPHIREASVKAFQTLAKNGREIILYDAPTLFQTGADTLCEAVIGVIACRETRIGRIIARDKLTGLEAAARVDAQPGSDFYRARCAYILENDSTPDALAEQVRAVWQKIACPEQEKPSG